MNMAKNKNKNYIVTVSLEIRNCTRPVPRALLGLELYKFQVWVVIFRLNLNLDIEHRIQVSDSKTFK
jgi:hypothetical protein